jgi:hypothetical protein
LTAKAITDYLSLVREAVAQSGITPKHGYGFSWQLDANRAARAASVLEDCDKISASLAEIKADGIENGMGEDWVDGYLRLAHDAQTDGGLEHWLSMMADDVAYICTPQPRVRYRLDMESMEVSQVAPDASVGFWPAPSPNWVGDVHKEITNMAQVAGILAIQLQEAVKEARTLK